MQVKKPAMGYNKSTIYNDYIIVQDKKSAMLDKKSTIYNDYITLQDKLPGMQDFKNKPFDDLGLACLYPIADFLFLHSGAVTKNGWFIIPHGWLFVLAQWCSH